jgi:hypothetical protein
MTVFENRVQRRIFVPKRDEVTGGYRNCIIRSFIIVLFAKYYYVYQIKEGEMRGACSTDRRDEECVQILV